MGLFNAWLAAGRLMTAALLLFTAAR